MRWIGLVLVLALVPAGVCEGKAKLRPEQRVNRLWNKVGRFYGPTKPPVSFGKVPIKGAAAVTTDIPGQAGPQDSKIYIGRGLTKDLRSRDPKLRRSTRHKILWEFGRAYQDERGDPWVMHKTNKVSHQLNKQQARRKKRHGLREILK